MKPSNLQLRLYFVTDLSVSVNSEFNPETDVNLHIGNMVVESEPMKKPDEDREWQIKMKVRHTQNSESNSPYFFAVELMGYFHIDESLPEALIEKFAFVNGSSILYSSAREILRNAMANGPYEPIMLPTVCFFEDDRPVEADSSD